MFYKIYKTEDDFFDNCPCAYEVYKFVDNIKDTDVRWFFDVCYADHYEDKYTVIFKSYITEEYKDYVLSVSATKINLTYEIKLVKKIDNLLS